MLLFLQRGNLDRNIEDSVHPGKSGSQNHGDARESGHHTPPCSNISSPTVSNTTTANPVLPAITSSKTAGTPTGSPSVPGFDFLLAIDRFSENGSTSANVSRDPSSSSLSNGPTSPKFLDPWATTSIPPPPVATPFPSPPDSPIRDLPSKPLLEDEDLPTDQAEIEQMFFDISWELYQYEWETDKAQRQVETIRKALPMPDSVRSPNASTWADYDAAVMQMTELNRYCQRLRARQFGLQNILPESSYIHEITDQELRVRVELHGRKAGEKSK